MITPYDRSGNVDYDKAAGLAQRLLANGSDGVVLAGTTGESPVLSSEEKERLFAAVRDRVGSEGLVIAATGTNDTRKTVEFTARAARVGVDGAMVVVPYYNKPSQSGLYAHFRAVADASDLPIMVYNVPSRTGVSIAPPTMAQIAAIPSVVAVKEASGNVLQVSQLRRLLPEGILVYSGDDPLTLPLLSLGAHGVVSVASHVVGRALRAMIEAFVAKETDRALDLHEKLLPLFEAIFWESNPVPIKVMLDALGFATGGWRLPLVAPEEGVRARIHETLAAMDAGLLDEQSAEGGR
jgi:4-hydroxy-tetrahydrodipicolinate synthase